MNQEALQNNNLEKKEYESPSLGSAKIFIDKGFDFEKIDESEASGNSNKPLVEVVYPEKKSKPDYRINYISNEIFEKLSPDEKLLTWMHGSNYQENGELRNLDVKNAKVVKINEESNSSEPDIIEVEIFGEKFTGQLSLMASDKEIIGYKFYPEFKTYNADPDYDIFLKKDLVPKEILQRDKESI